MELEFVERDTAGLWFGKPFDTIHGLSVPKADHPEWSRLTDPGVEGLIFFEIWNI